MMSFLEYHEEEDGTFEDEGVLYNINKIFDITENKPVTEVAIADLTWIEPKSIPMADLKRASGVDITVPVIVMKKNGKLLVVDGYHRMLKAEKYGIKKLPAKFITKQELETTKK
jgi:hypothetical protein